MVCSKESSSSLLDFVAHCRIFLICSPIANLLPIFSGIRFVEKWSQSCSWKLMEQQLQEFHSEVQIDLFVDNKLFVEFEVLEELPAGKDN